MHVYTSCCVICLQVLDGQRSLEQWRSKIEETLLDLQSKVAQYLTPTPSSSSPESSSGPGKKRKQIVTRTLSVSFCSFVLEYIYSAGLPISWNGTQSQCKTLDGTYLHAKTQNTLFI